jgi:hypothetical protein
MTCGNVLGFGGRKSYLNIPDVLFLTMTSLRPKTPEIFPRTGKSLMCSFYQSYTLPNQHLNIQLNQKWIPWGTKGQT